MRLSKLNHAFFVVGYVFGENLIGFCFRALFLEKNKNKCFNFQQRSYEANTIVTQINHKLARFSVASIHVHQSYTLNKLVYRLLLNDLFFIYIEWIYLWQ